MTAKTYRVEAELAKEACEKMIEYIAENREVVTEAQVINASIKKGLESLTHEDIRKYIDSKN